MQKLQMQKTVLNRTLTAEVSELDEGILVLLTGGDRSHIGAVSMTAPGEALQTLERTGHRDAEVSRIWAERLAAACGQPVTVCCGIHYDQISKQGIAEVLQASAELCGEVLQQLPKSGEQKASDMPSTK